MIRFGAYRLDRAQGLWRDGDEVRLTPKSLSLLCVLVEHAGDVVSKEELFRLVWPDTVVSDSALASCIQELRRALRDDAQRPKFIETLHRRGYRFRGQVSRDLRQISRGAALAPPSSMDRPIVGREEVIEDMLGAGALAERGSRQVLFVTGEAGVGKTTVVRGFSSKLEERGASRATWGQCIQHYGIGESYQPLLEALGRLCRQGDDDLIALLERYSPTWLAQLPALIPPERLERLQRTVAGITRGRMLRELSDALEVIAARTPLVIWLEDLHWSDASTLDWIAAFAQRTESACVLLIGTFRPTPPEHPLTAVVDDLRMKGFCREISLRGLDEPAVADYMALRYPPALGHGESLRRLARLVHQHTGGNPLFVVNVIDDLAARGLLVSHSERWTLTRDVNPAELGIPDDVRRMIGKQIDRLEPDERDILECASVVGASFSTAAVAAAANRSLETIESTLTTLVRQGHFVRYVGPLEWPDGTMGARFDFLHVLYRDVLYQRLSPARLAQLHKQVGIRIEMAYGVRAPELAAELAMHFERGGELSRVGVYLQRAAQNARRRGAYREAQAHFDRALALLESEAPGPERSARELELQIGRGAAIMAARGWSAPAAADAYTRAHALSRELGDTPHLFPALWGLWIYYQGRGPLSTAQDLVQDLLGLARQDGGDAARLQAEHAAWATAFGRGDLRASCGHASIGMRVYDIEHHAALAETYGSHDAEVCGHLFLGWALALRGELDEAERVSLKAVELARSLRHPFSLALTHVFAAAAAHTRRDTNAIRVNADAAVAVAREQEFRLMLGWGLSLKGWVTVSSGRFQEGMDQLMNGLAETRATGAFMLLPYFLSLKAQAQSTEGRPADGLEVLEEAFSVVRATGECFWEAELHRLKGELQLAANGPAAHREAEHSFVQAIDVATNQEAKLLVLRASVSLGRLLRRLKRDVEARQRVGAALAEISKGVGWPDVVDARAFLASDAHSPKERA